MQVQSFTNLKSVALAPTDSSKPSEVGNSFARLISEAIQSNPDYNLDYVIAAKTSKPVQDSAVNIAAPNVQTQAALDVNSWLDSHSQLSAALSKSTEPAVQEPKSNAIEKPSQAKILPYLDANGQPTNPRDTKPRSHAAP